VDIILAIVIVIVASFTACLSLTLSLFGRYWKRIPREVGTHQFKVRMVGVRAAPRGLSLGDAEPRATASVPVDEKKLDASLGLTPLEDEYRLGIHCLPFRVQIEQALLDHLVELAEEFDSGKGKKESKEGQGKSRGHVKDDTGAMPGRSFFQLVRMGELVICLDYRPSGVDVEALRNGDMRQLLNLTPLTEVTLRLRRVTFRGVNGFEAAVREISESYVEQVLSSQLPRILSGLPLVRSVVVIGSELCEVLLLPLALSQRDANPGDTGAFTETPKPNIKTPLQVLHHTRRSLNKFLRTVSIETISASRSLTQSLATLLDSATGQEFSAPPQPAGGVEGLLQSKAIVERSLKDTVSVVCVVAADDESTIGDGFSDAGLPMASNGVVKAMPIAIVKTAASAMHSLSHTLLTARNVLDPNLRREEEEEWS